MLDGWQSEPGQAEAGAVHYLNLCALAAGGWIAARLLKAEGTAAPRIRRAARAFLDELTVRAATEASLACPGATRLDEIDASFEA